MKTVLRFAIFALALAALVALPAVAQPVITSVTVSPGIVGPPPVTDAGLALTFSIFGSGLGSGPPAPQPTVRWTQGGVSQDLLAQVVVGAAAPYVVAVLPSPGAAPGPGTVAVVSAGGAVSNALPVTVNPPLVLMPPANIPQGTAGHPYSVTLLSGGTPSYSLTTGALPAWLTAPNFSRTLSGTPPAAGPYPFTVFNAVDAVTSLPLGNGVTYSITINPAVQITSGGLPRGIAGTAYPAFPFTATGGTGGLTWSLSGAPPWLTVNPTTGGLTAGPVVAGTYNFQVQATDTLGASDSMALTLIIDPPLTVTPAALPPGLQNTPYSQVVGVSGGFGPYSITVGGLPAPLTFNPSNNTISGTPAAAGTSTVSVFVLDAFSRTITVPLNLRVDAPLAVTQTSLPDGNQGTPYSQPITVTGGFGPYTVTVTGLPPGLNYNTGTGNVTGTPTAYGFYSPSVAVTDSLGRQVSTFLSLTITVTFQITTASPLPSVVVGTPYTQALSATPTQGLIVSWSLAQGSTLPNPLTLTSGGVISGVPSQPGTYNFTVQATAAPMPGDQSVPPLANQTAARQFTLVVSPPLTITTTLLGQALVGEPYFSQLAVIGGTPPFTWSITAGALPEGLQFNSQPGLISGSPTATGTFHFTAQVTDSMARTVTRPLSLEVVRRILLPLEVLTASLPDATYGQSYAAPLVADGGEEPYRWSAAGLPAGLAVSSQGSIAGTPQATGVFPVMVTVTDFADRAASRTISLNVKTPPLSITTASPLAADVGAALSVTFGATGGVPPYVWSVTGGLPPGTSFTAGILAGTPNTDGTFRFTVQARDSLGATVSKSFDLTVTALPLSVAGGALPDGHAGGPYTAAVSAAGGFPPYTWALAGLPAGLAGDASGAIGGTPTAAGQFTVQATATDSRNNSATGTYTLTIGPRALSLTGIALPGGRVGEPYSATIAAEGGTPPYQYAIVAGFAGGGLSMAGNALSGAPTDAGDYDFFVQVRDAAGATATGRFSLTVEIAALTVTTASLPDGTVGAPYAASVSASGNLGAVRWSAGGLPGGLSMDSGGAIGGTPAAPGTFSVSVSATDDAGRTADRTFSLTVVLPATPNPSFRGVPDTTNPGAQVPVGLGLDGSYPVPITGTITLAFTADSGNPDDPAVQFSSGGRTVSFTIPAGANLATFTIPNLALQTGTVAGTIRLTANLTAMGQSLTPTPSQTIRINRMGPVITRVAVTRAGTGLNVEVTGYSNTRELTQAIFRFTAASGATLQNADVTVSVSAMFASWYQNPASLPYGSQFLFTQPFTVSDATGIASISVTLVNSVGQSLAVSGNVP